METIKKYLRFLYKKNNKPDLLKLAIKGFCVFIVLFVLGSLVGGSKKFITVDEAIKIKLNNPEAKITASLDKESSSYKIFTLNVKSSKKQNGVYYIVAPLGDQLVEQYLKTNDINVDYSVIDSNLTSNLINLLSLILFIYFIRKVMPSNKKKFALAERVDYSFDDIAGVDEVKAQVKEVVDLFNDSSKIQKIGGKVPKGLLLIGPPGTGKTLLAKAAAGESKASFISISGSDFVELWVGNGAKKVRELFETAKKNSPCIIFIDEIDSVARKRGSRDSHSEQEQTINQLLAEMDGFEESKKVLIFAATNRPEILDDAILRPGRFDRQIHVGLPDLKGRKQILEIHTRSVSLATDVNLEIIAKDTARFSGADLANLVNESAIIASKKNKNSVDMHDFYEAKDKIQMGTKSDFKLNDEDRKLTAYHEAGHALVARLLDLSKLEKVTIIPRGQALGLTQLESEDTYSYSKERLEKTLIMLLGGRVAEKVFFNHVSTGARSDLERSTALARRMVGELGMSDKLGPISYSLESAAYLSLAEQTKRDIDLETASFVKSAEESCIEVISKNRETIAEISKQLLDKETLTGDEVQTIIDRFKSI